MAAEGKLTAKDFSLLSNDVMSLKGFLLHFVNAALRPEGEAGAATPPALTSLGGPSNGLKDGVVLHKLWEKLTGTKGEYDPKPANDMAQKANLWGVLAQIEDAGVRPVLPHHAWDAESIHSGDVVANITLIAAIAAHRSVRLPPDICYWNDNPAGGPPQRVALTPTIKTTPRGQPLMVCQVMSDTKSKGVHLIFRRDAVVVGRVDEEDAEGDVQVDDDTVSATHCRVWFDGHEFRVKDLGSTHGTHVAPPWSREFDDLGNRDKPNGEERALFRGSEIAMGDTALVVVHVESTDMYSDYPLIGGQFGLNLEITAGPPFMGQTVLGVRYPGISLGSAAAAPASLSATGVQHARIGDLDANHAAVFFSNFYGRYLFSNNGNGVAKIQVARPPAPAPGAPPMRPAPVSLPKGAFAFVENGDQLFVGGNVFRATVIPPAAAPR